MTCLPELEMVLVAHDGEKQANNLASSETNFRKLTLSPSSTSQSFSSVAGLKTGNFLPLTELCHSLFMKICREEEKVDKQALKYGANLIF